MNVLGDYRVDKRNTNPSERQAWATETGDGSGSVNQVHQKVSDHIVGAKSFEKAGNGV